MHEDNLRAVVESQRLHPKKKYGESRGLDPLILTSALNGGGWSGLRPAVNLGIRWLGIGVGPWACP
jgi:hypothetical protein